MASKSAPRPPEGVSVLRLLLIAAVLGGVTGVALAKRQQHVEEEEDLAHATYAEKVLPEGKPVDTFDQMAPDPISLRGIPPYPGGQPRKLYSAKAGVALNAISWFETDDSLDKVLGFYEQGYATSNISYDSYRWPKRGYVSWFEHAAPPEDGGVGKIGAGVMHMVSVFDEGSRRVVMMSATDPKRILEELNSLPGGVVIPAGATPQVINNGEFGQYRWSIFASYAKMSKETLVATMKRQLAEQGWEVSETPGDGPGVNLMARLNNRQQTIVIDGTTESSRLGISLEEH